MQWVVLQEKHLESHCRFSVAQFSWVQFSHSVVSDSLWTHELQHTRPPCPSTPRVHSDSSIELVMPSSHLILCRPLFLLPPIPPSIIDLSNESTLWMRWPKLLSRVQLFVIPWTAAHQASLPLTVPRSCSNSCPLSRWYLPTTSSSVTLFYSCPQSQHQGFANELTLCIMWPKYWSFSISPSNEYSGLISFRIDWFDFFAVQGTLKSFLQHHNLKASILWYSAFFISLRIKSISCHISKQGCHNHQQFWSAKCKFLSPKATQEVQYLLSGQLLELSTEETLVPDSWDAHERNDFSEPTFLHLLTHRKAQNSLIWDIWFSLIHKNTSDV